MNQGGFVVDTTKNAFIDELKAMKNRMEELFLNSFETGQSEAGEEMDSVGWMPAVDVVDAEKEIIYMLDLPGVLEDDLRVECKSDRLWVSGKKREDVPVSEALLLAERPRGPFSRVFKLPCPVLSDQIQAELKKGVLRIVVPKECSSASRTRKIVVRGED